MRVLWGGGGVLWASPPTYPPIIINRAHVTMYDGFPFLCFYLSFFSFKKKIIMFLKQ